MKAALVAEFDEADRFVAALRQARAAGLTPLDALSPAPMPEIDECLPPGRSSIRLVMAGAGLATALFSYGLEAYSAGLAYPIDSGGRPLQSWPVFLLAPFEVGILAAALAGFVAFLIGCGLPRLNQPLFDYPGIERASQDRYFILLARAADEQEDEKARRMLFDAGAVSIGTADT